MRVLVDTTVLSLVLRRRDQNRLAEDERRVVNSFVELARRGLIGIIGMVRQEVLSGLKNDDQFSRLRIALEGFAHVGVERDDHDLAARMINACRSRGVAMGAVDALLCAAAARRRAEIFTLDQDFELYARHVAIELYPANQ